MSEQQACRLIPHCSLPIANHGRPEQNRTGIAAASTEGADASARHGCRRARAVSTMPGAGAESRRKASERRASASAVALPLVPRLKQERDGDVPLGHNRDMGAMPLWLPIFGLALLVGVGIVAVFAFPRDRRAWSDRRRTEFDRLLTAIEVIGKRTDDRLAALTSHVAEYTRLPPFVAVLVHAQGEKGPVTMGMSGHLKTDQSLLETTTQVPLTQVRVTVFCDLERVAIYGIFAGTELRQAQLGDCPVAAFERLDVGVKLRVQCTRRDVLGGAR